MQIMKIKCAVCTQTSKILSDSKNGLSRQIWEHVIISDTMAHTSKHDTPEHQEQVL